jgi:hypothetical protein
VRLANPVAECPFGRIGSINAFRQAAEAIHRKIEIIISRITSVEA